MSGHPEWIEQLSDYLDGELGGAEHDAVERHLAACPGCTAALNDLRSVVLRAQALPPHEPSADLWDGIAAGITPTASQRIATISRRRFSFTFGQLAAAAVLLIAVSGWIAVRFLSAPAGRVENRTETTDDTFDRLPVSNLAAARFDDPGYDAAVNDLEATLEENRAALDPATVKLVEDDLLIIDQALDEARQALVRDPANDYLAEHLVDTKRRKFDLLRHAAALSAGLD